MTRPFMTPWVEEPNLFARRRIDTGQIGPLMVVVRQASEGQIRCDRAAPMLLGDDVIDLEARRGKDLRQPAIFAAVTSAPTHEIGKGCVHSHQDARWGFFLRAFRALDWRMSNTQPRRSKVSSSSCS